MSSKKFVYLVMTVAIVFGFMTSGAVYGQSTGTLTFKGKVLNADGTPAPGYTISGETVPVNNAYTFIAIRRGLMVATVSLSWAFLSAVRLRR